MRLPALLAACIFVIPSYTTAQTTAADGVVALFQGDAALVVLVAAPSTARAPFSRLVMP
jgi:hypothetical protein